MTFLAFRCNDGEHRIGFEPAQECIVSWGAQRHVDIDLRVQIADGRRSSWLSYVRRDPWRSCSSKDDIAQINVDVTSAILPIVALEIRTQGVGSLFVATPPQMLPISHMARVFSRVAIPLALSVPAFSQYIDEERGWCAAASLAMVMVYWAQRKNEPSYLVDVRTAAAEIYDHDYKGTGNWTFATAYANMRGLLAAVVYLRDLDHAQEYIMAQIPLILSITWEENQLEGAPLPRSDGHLLVLRGFDQEGYALVNDPALPDIVGRYRRNQLESAWRRASRVCYAIAPPSHPDFLALLGRP